MYLCQKGSNYTLVRYGMIRPLLGSGSAIKSYLSHLECTGCCAQYHPHQPMRTCSKCGKVLFPRYDLAALKRVLADGVVGAEATIVLLNTGSGLKYLELVE